MVMEGRVSVVESEVPAQAVQLASQTIIGLVATDDGIKPNVLEDNTPAYFASANALIEAIINEAGLVTGTIWEAALGIRANVSSPVIVSIAASTTTAHVDAAIDAMANPVNGVLPDILIAPKLNAAAASGAGDDVLSHLRDTCELLDAVYVANIRNSGANKVAQITNAKAYAEANAHTRGILMYSRGLLNAADVDISAHYAGALARHDAEIHRGANPRGIEIRGISDISPRIIYNDLGRGNQNDDVSNLLASNINPVSIVTSGIRAWGTRFSGEAFASQSAYRDINARRTIDQIVINVRRIAQPYLDDNLDSAIVGVIVSAIDQSLSTMQGIGQIRGYDVGLNPDLNTQTNLDNGILYLRVTAQVPGNVNAIHIDVRASRGSLTIAA